MNLELMTSEPRHLKPPLVHRGQSSPQMRKMARVRQQGRVETTANWTLTLPLQAVTGVCFLLIFSFLFIYIKVARI